jgi:hypothetical protein
VITPPDDTATNAEPDDLQVAVTAVTRAIRAINASHPASNDNLTDAWGSDLASLLYQHARDTTPLPGTDTAPDWPAGQRHADAILAAGHWPHLRIPTLAHYATPTDTKEN